MLLAYLGLCDHLFIFIFTCIHLSLGFQSGLTNLLYTKSLDLPIASIIVIDVHGQTFKFVIANPSSGRYRFS